LKKLILNKFTYLKIFAVPILGFIARRAFIIQGIASRRGGSPIVGTFPTCANTSGGNSSGKQRWWQLLNLIIFYIKMTF
jgi:hypothetical protein